jgi:hypothetical protein
MAASSLNYDPAQQQLLKQMFLKYEIDASQLCFALIIFKTKPWDGLLNVCYQPWAMASIDLK